MSNILNTLGLAYRAKKTIVSVDEILNYKGEIYIVFVASNISSKTLKTLSEYKINNEFSQEELSHSIGLNGVKAIALIDEGFYKLTQK